MLLLDHTEVTCFSFMIKILKGEGGGKDKEARREKRIIVMQLPDILLETASGSHNFSWQKQLRECKWESFVEEPRAGHLKSGHYNHAVSGDLAPSLD